MACMCSVLSPVVISLLRPLYTRFWVQLWSRSMACMYSILSPVVISFLWLVCNLFWVQLWSRFYGLYILGFESSCDLASMACMYSVLSLVVISLWHLCTLPVSRYSVLSPVVSCMMYSVLSQVSPLLPVCILFWACISLLCFESSCDLASMACMYSVLSPVVISLLWPVCTLFWV